MGGKITFSHCQLLALVYITKKPNSGSFASTKVGLQFSVTGSWSEAGQGRDYHISCWLSGISLCKNNWKQVGRIRMIHAFTGFLVGANTGVKMYEQHPCLQQLQHANSPAPQHNRTKKQKPMMLPAEPYPSHKERVGNRECLEVYGPIRSLDKGHCQNVPLQISTRSPELVSLSAFTF